MKAPFLTITQQRTAKAVRAWRKKIDKARRTLLAVESRGFRSIANARLRCKHNCYKAGSYKAGYCRVCGASPLEQQGIEKLKKRNKAAKKEQAR